jgi:hypothetical protein
MDREAVKSVLRGQEIELPSWAFGNSGTRFKVFAQPGVPRDPYEKIADAAQVHEYTGVAPRVSLHIPWDRVDDYRMYPPRSCYLYCMISPIRGRFHRFPCSSPPRTPRVVVHHLLEHRLNTRMARLMAAASPLR